MFQIDIYPEGKTARYLLSIISSLACAEEYRFWKEIIWDKRDKGKDTGGGKKVKEAENGEMG